MKRNPVYPKEWQDIKLGDVVDIKFHHWKKAKRGEVIEIRDFKGRRFYDVRLAGGNVFGNVEEDEMRLIKKYKENPILEPEWDIPFKVGDRVLLWNTETGTISGTNHQYGEMWYDVRLDTGQELINVSRRDISIQGMKDNPVYPREWTEGNYKEGAFVRITKPDAIHERHRNQLVKIVRVDYLSSGPLYIVKAVSNSGEPLHPSYGFWLNEWEISPAEAGIPEAGGSMRRRMKRYRRNPIYPASFIKNDPKFSIGDNVIIIKPQADVELNFKQGRIRNVVTSQKGTFYEIDFFLVVRGRKQPFYAWVAEDDLAIIPSGFAP